MNRFNLRDALTNHGGIVVVLVLTAAAYSPVLHAGFVWDDFDYIVNQSALRSLGNIDAIFAWDFWDGDLNAAMQSYYRPMTFLGFAIDHQVWSGHPHGFHLTNLLLHLGTITLLYWLALIFGAGPSAAAAASGVFAVFPRLTESVAWVSGRADIQACLGVLLFLGFYDQRRPRWQQVAGCAFLLAALLSKEVAIAGGIAVVLAALQRPDQDRGYRWALAGPAAVFAAWFTTRSLALQSANPFQASYDPAFLDRIGDTLQTAGLYAWMVADPFKPQVLIGTPGIRDPLTMLAGGAAVIGVAFGLWRIRRGDVSHGTRIGTWLAAVSILPVLNLLPMDQWTLASDRLLYVPMAGLSLVAAVAFKNAGPRMRRICRPTVPLLIGLMAVATYSRSLDWQSSTTLWQAAAEVSGEEHEIPWLMLGLHASAAGDCDLAVSMLTKARAVSLELSPKRGWSIASFDQIAATILACRGQ